VRRWAFWFWLGCLVPTEQGPTTPTTQQRPPATELESGLAARRKWAATQVARMLEDSQLGVAGAGESTFTAKRMAKFRGVQLRCPARLRLPPHVPYDRACWGIQGTTVVSPNPLLDRARKTTVVCDTLFTHTHTHILESVLSTQMIHSLCFARRNRSLFEYASCSVLTLASASFRHADICVVSA